MQPKPLTVAWISFFPVEWLPDAPEEVRRIERLHAASWQRVLLGELEKVANLRLHIVVLRKQFQRNLTFKRNGVTFHLLKTPGGMRAPSFFWLDTMLIKRVLQRVKPDVVHAWGTEQGAALVAQRLGYPHLVTIQGLMSWYATVSPPNKHDRMASFMERYTLKRSPLVTTEARFSVHYVQQHYSRPQVEQVEHAPDWIFHRLSRKPQANPVRFISIGGLDYRKGGDLLLRSLEELKDEMPFEMVIVGKQPDFFKSLLGSASTEVRRRTVVKADLTPQEVGQEMSAATMLICASRADVSPNAVKEAAVAGVPVIGSLVGGIPDYVFSGRNGILFAPNDLVALVDSIRIAIVHPLFRDGRVEQEILARTREYLSPELMGKRFLEVYELARTQNKPH